MFILEQLKNGEVHELAYYGKNESKFKRYLKRLWSAIRGKEYLIFGIVLSPEEANGLRGALIEMTADKESERT